MSDRTVAVRLTARVDEYKRNLTDAAKATQQFGSKSAASVKSVSKELASIKTESTIAGASMLALAGTAVLASARFDKSMSAVKAVSGATAAEMDKLRQAALDAGQATVFSASEAADAEAELARAGVKTADILSGALTGSLDLAAAGQLDLADAATISAQAMNVFGLKGRDVSHIADVLAAGANKSAADVKQLGDALRQGGLVADQTGLSLEETVGALSAFADRALIGSDAGTSLKTMLQRLTPQSDEAKDAMDELGIKAFDASGNFVGLAEFAGNLRESMKNLTPEARASAQAVIFGSDAVRGANVLYDLGEKGVRDYTNAVNDQGAASRMAATQLDNLAGDYEQLSGSIETTFIKSGSGANGLLREMTQAATATVNVIGDLPAPILATGLAVTTAGGAFFIAAPRIANFNAALKTTPKLAAIAKGALKGLGPAFAVLAVADIAFAVMDANEQTEQFVKTWEELRSALSKDISTDSADALYQQIKQLQDTLDHPGFQGTLARGWDAFWNWGTDTQSNYERQLDALNTMQTEYERYKSVVADVANIMGVDVARAMQLVDESGVGLAGSTAEVVGKVKDYVAATQTGGAASQDAAAAMDTLADSTLSAKDQLKALQDQWDATIGVMLGLSDAQIGAESALDDLVKSLKKNGNAWNINTEAGRANQSAWNNLVDAAGRVRQKKLEEGASVDKANEAYRKYLERVKAAPGLTDAQRAAVQRLIDKYKAVPATVETKVTADTSEAWRKLSKLGAYYASLTKSSYALGGSTYQSQVPKAASSSGAAKAPSKASSSSPKVAATMPGSSGASTVSGASFTVQQLNVTAPDPASTAQSVTTALRREAFLQGFGG